MKQSLESQKKIALIGLSPAWGNILQEQFAAYKGLSISNDSDFAVSPDVVITSFAGAHHPGCPVIAVPPDQHLRLGALLRQIGQALAEPSLYLDDIAIGPYAFSPPERILTRPNGEAIVLTDREVDILVYLARQRGVPAPRDEMLKAIWRYQDGVDTHTLETHIYRLRQKIEISADAPEILVTEEGGYKLASLGKEKVT